MEISLSCHHSDSLLLIMCLDIFLVHCTEEEPLSACPFLYQIKVSVRTEVLVVHSLS